HENLVVLDKSDQSGHNPVLFIKKGTDPKVDSYSAFWDNEHATESELRVKLQEAGIETVFLVGLALDVCVYFSALDAAEAGFQTHIIDDCCCPVNTEESPEMVEKKRKLKEAGVKLISSQQVSQFLL